MNRLYQSSFTARTNRCFRILSTLVFALGLLIFLSGNAAHGRQAGAQGQRGWIATGSLNTGRFGHTATLLKNGNVLVAGGLTCTPACGELNSAELYDAATGVWRATGNMSLPRRAHIAVGLPDGKVLVAGGTSAGTILGDAELYDLETGLWSPTGDLSSVRELATATLLANGTVLVAGGLGSTQTALNSTELYDPSTGSWAPTGTMSAARARHTATLLADGRVLIAGGIGAGEEMLLTAEIYDPKSGSWTPTGSLGTGRVFHTSTLLDDGRVLVIGGGTVGTTVYDTTEIYDPRTGQWSAVGKLIGQRASHSATLLANGKVLVVGGFNGGAVDFTLKSAELFDPATGSSMPAPDLNVQRTNHDMTMLLDGRVLISGGRQDDSIGITSAELFGGNSTIPQITGASLSGKLLLVEGKNFDEGAKVFLNDDKQKTAIEIPAVMLRCKKAGKKIEPGATVRLKVRNSDGTESAEFNYTRSLT